MNKKTPIKTIAIEGFIILIFIALGIISALLLCKIFPQKPPDYYYVYSAMIQAVGALIALVSIFVIFKIQIQMQRIKGDYEMVLPLYKSEGEYLSTEKLDIYMAQSLSNRKGCFFDFIKEINDRINKNKDILHYTRMKGRIIIFLYTFLFIYYIFAMHLNYVIFNDSVLPLIVLFVGFSLSIFTIIRTIYYLMKCLRQDS